MELLALIKALQAQHASAEVIQAEVGAWLEDHPEASTTVQDGAITYAKLHSDLQGAVDDVSDLKSAIGDVNAVLDKLSGEESIVEFEWISNSYVTEQGVITPYNGWHRTDYIDINGAEKIRLYATSGSTSQLYNCWYNSNKVCLGNFLCNSAQTEYTPPEGAKYFILSTSNANSVTMGVVNQTVSGLRQISGNSGAESFTYRGNLAVSETYNTTIGFAPKIGFKCGMYAEMSSAFDKVTFQFDAYSPNQIIVDGTNVTLKARFAEDVVLSHHISIEDNIQVNILMDSAAEIKVTVASNGEQNTVTGAFVVTAYEPFKIINGTTALSNVVFTMGCASVDHNIWVFGDSYLGMTNTARWPYYINQNGFTKNALFCGSTGSGAAESALWLASLLKLRTPEKIIWCMGMNYVSDNGSAATAWLSQVEALEATCAAKGIELILATIPTVPSLNHEYKNAYVRSSGHRYIDFAQAVGAQSNGHWIGYGTDKDMLSSDNVHPSVYGAVALYNMAIASVPELVYN